MFKTHFFSLILLISLQLSSLIETGHKRHSHRTDRRGRKDRKETKHSPYVHVSCRRSNMVALTFDDGVNEYTPQILDILERRGVSATFFIIGSTLEDYDNQRILRRIYRAGHSIGGHSYDHSDMSWMTASQIEYQLDTTASLIREAIGHRVHYFRPPFGYVSDAMLSVVENNGYIPIKWNVDSEDWRCYTDNSLIFNNLNNAEYTKGSKNVLFHDRQVTVDSLSAVISFYRRQGYYFVNMRECLGF